MLYWKIPEHWLCDKSEEGMSSGFHSRLGGSHFYYGGKNFAGYARPCSPRNKAIQGKVCRRGPQKVNLKVLTWRRTAIAIFACTSNHRGVSTRARGCGCEVSRSSSKNGITSTEYVTFILDSLKRSPRNERNVSKPRMQMPYPLCNAACR